MKTQFPLALLASPHLLHHFTKGEGEQLGTEDFQRLTMVEVWDRTHHYPDHMRQNSFKSMYGAPGYPSLFYDSLKWLANTFLDWMGNTIVVREEHFDEWQTVISEVSPLLILACHIAEASRRSQPDDDHLRELVRLNIHPHVFPGFAAPRLDGALREVGLCDAHVHLNGSTPGDTIWLHALARPKRFRMQLKDEWKGSKSSEVEELFQQVSPLFPREDIPNMVDIATNLRHWMIRCIFTEGGPPPCTNPSVLMEDVTEVAQRNGATVPHGSEEKKPPNHCHTCMHHTAGNLPAQCFMHAWWLSLVEERPLQAYTLNRFADAKACAPHTLEVLFPSAASGLESDLQQEAYFLVRLLREIREGEREYLARCAHYYVLIQHYVNKLLVQHARQCGFDQFQKITETGIRELAEKEYSQRLKQFSSCAADTRIYVEGRFAPKACFKKLCQMLEAIHKAAQKYAPSEQGRQDAALRLGLVAHFIKQNDKSPNMGCQYYKFRRSLEKQARLLLEHRRVNSEPLFAGIDAAANELHTPPEVFAPVFRYLRRRDITKATFHVGEDYRHLISGVRAIEEALTFLDLGPGARLGHATAVGISPRLWRERVGDSLALERTKWLDTLVYAHHYLVRAGRFSEDVGKSRDAIEEQSRRVYGTAHDAHLLWEAWMLRKLDPLRAFIDKDPARCIFPEDKQEWQDIDTARKEKAAAFALFAAYHGQAQQRCPLPQPPCTHQCAYCKESPELCPCPHRCEHCADAYRKYRLAIKESPKPPTQKRREEIKNEFETVSTDFFSDDAMIYLQQNVLKQIVEKRVAIESMISSNVRISFYKTYDEHHIIRWLGLDTQFNEEPLPMVCLGTDDPGIFCTSIKNECLHLLRILRRRKNMTDTQAIDIITGLLKNSHACVFTLPTQPALSVREGTA